MTSSRNRHALSIWALWLFAGPVQPAEPETLTLPTVVEAGFARYPELPLIEAIRGQSQAIQSQASSLLADDPALIVRHESDAANNDAGYRQWEGGVAMPLWLPGQRGRRYKVAEATAREADATGRLQKWQVAGAIREVLWSLQIAETELDSCRTCSAEREAARSRYHGPGEGGRTGPWRSHSGAERIAGAGNRAGGRADES